MFPISLSHSVFLTISLDDLYENAHAFRENYCKSVILAAMNADRGIFRVANAAQSPLLGKLVYAMLMCPDPQGRLFSFEQYQNVVFVAVTLIACLTATSMSA
jgi:hypothetical protein